MLPLRHGGGWRRRNKIRRHELHHELILHQCNEHHDHDHDIYNRNKYAVNQSDFYLPSSLTIILPAYNEENRIGPTIDRYSSYLSNFTSPILVEKKKKKKKNKKFTAEHERQQKQQRNHGSLAYDDIQYKILVVDDGSTDNTRQVVQSMSSRNIYTNMNISCLSLDQNQGKGSAISRGIQETVRESLFRKDELLNISKECSDVILIADADGSGDIQSLENMMVELWNTSCRNQNSNELHTHPNSNERKKSWTNPAIVVGNRGYKGTSISRGITRWGFRTAVKLACGDLNVKDTQCGFKLMTLNAASVIYKDLNLKRWTNDVEALYRAKLLGIPVSEIIVQWKDKEGSKLASTIWETINISIVMLAEIIYMRMLYVIGVWSV